MIEKTDEMKKFLEDAMEGEEFWYIDIDKLERVFNRFVNEFDFNTWYDMVGENDVYLYCTTYIENLYNWHGYNVIIDVDCSTYFKTIDEMLDFLISKENFANEMALHLKK